MNFITALKEAAESPEKEAKEKHQNEWNGKIVFFVHHKSFSLSPAIELLINFCCSFQNFLQINQFEMQHLQFNKSFFSALFLK